MLLNLVIVVVIILIGYLTVSHFWFNPSHSSVINNIPPVASNFKWETQQPLPIRPFVNKRNFNPSMAIKNISDTPQDWLLIENTYYNNVRQRQKHIALEPEILTFIHNNNRTKQAVGEFYDMVTQFLLLRYPMYFKYDFWSGMITNTITNDKFPKYSKSLIPNYQSMVEILGRNIEEDFLILIKNNPHDKEEEYIMRASLNGFPAGFDPRVNFNQPISFIHQPVPQYKSRLQFSMTKFFNNLQPDKLWVRHNWGIQTHNMYFNMDTNHGRPGDKIHQLSMNEIDFDNEGCCLRCERQLFTRMPQSGAIIMTIRTYLTPIKTIKQEGLGKELSRAIDGLPDDLAFYKKRNSWGEAVKEYLAI